MTNAGYKLGDIIKTKKAHVCGSDLWEIVRLGADVKLKCTQCGREIVMYRFELAKRISKKTIK